MPHSPSHKHVFLHLSGFDQTVTLWYSYQRATWDCFPKNTLAYSQESNHQPSDSWMTYSTSWATGDNRSYQSQLSSTCADLFCLSILLVLPLSPVSVSKFYSVTWFQSWVHLCAFQPSWRAYLKMVCWLTHWFCKRSSPAAFLRLMRFFSCYQTTESTVGWSSAPCLAQKLLFCAKPTVIVKCVRVRTFGLPMDQASAKTQPALPPAPLCCYCLSQTFCCLH